MTDIAAIFHWPLSELEALPIDELITWRSRAIDWWNRTQGGKR
jgi:hypothetical protein